MGIDHVLGYRCAVREVHGLTGLGHFKGAPCKQAENTRGQFLAEIILEEVESTGDSLVRNAHLNEIMHQRQLATVIRIPISVALDVASCDQSARAVRDDIDGSRRDSFMSGSPSACCQIQPVRQVRQARIEEAVGDTLEQGRPGDRSQLTINGFLGRGTVVCRGVQSHGDPPVPQSGKEIGFRRVTNIIEGTDDIIVGIGQRLERQLVRGQTRVEQPFLKAGH